MARGFILASILLVGLCLGGNTGAKSKEFEDRPTGSAKPFEAGHEYSFTYNSQIATGLSQDPKCTGESGRQKSITRIQSVVKIQFQSERYATLRMEKIRIGTLNEQIPDSQQVQPMGMFEQKQIPSQRREVLQLPCQFSYVGGVVERIQFSSEDPVWSKNIKRAVLNLVQLNLQRNNAQQLRGDEQLTEGKNDEEKSDLRMEETKAFTLPEITLEGECQTTYTINMASRHQMSDSTEKGYERMDLPVFNVTKSINFKQCKKISDVAYGYQTQPQQMRCIQCQQQWAKNQQQQMQGGIPGQLPQNLPHPCDECDPKEIKEQTLERSTVQRFVLKGKMKKFGISRAEQISQYMYKNLRAEVGQCEGSALQAVAASELIFRSVEKKEGQYYQMRPKSGNTEEDTILYDNEWDMVEKRFYMYGDNDFGSTPFDKVQGKVDLIHHLLRKLTSGPNSASDKANGIEVDTTMQLQRLVELLRMCTVRDLKEIQERLSQQQQQNNVEQQKIEHLLVDALAIAGTRNTIHVLVERILKKQLSPTKAAQTLRSLSNLPAPSDAQVEEILRLCKNEVSHRAGGALQQSCWLTFGSMVGELCQHSTQKSAQQSAAFGGQSGFNKDEVCPSHKKEIYKAAMAQQFEQAETLYEKLLALKALGNAGIDISTSTLEQIINDRRQGHIVRVQAIDALRRLRTQIPRKIQRLLLPLFQNTREHAEVRMAAFSMIMHTLPEKEIIDQIAYALMKEPFKHVRSFVFTTMKALSKSKVPGEQELAKHLKNALKLSNIDENSLRSSVKLQVPIYSENEKEGVFLNLVSVFSSRNMLPVHLAAQLDTLLNDEFQMSSLRVSLSQRDIESWYLKLMRAMQLHRASTRGQRSSQSQGFRDQLKSITSGLGIKARSDSYRKTSNEQLDDEQSDRQQPFGMLSIRVGDVDQVIVPVDANTAPQSIMRMLRGLKLSMANGDLSDLLNIGGSGAGKHFRFLTALNVNERSAKIPTSIGLPIRILSAFPVLTSVEGQIQSEQNGIKIAVHPSISACHVQKMETWMPITVTGVESVRSIEINLPIQVQAQNAEQGGLELLLKAPQSPSKTLMFGLHTLPVTYTREFDQKSNILREPRVSTIQSEQLQQLQRSVNTVVGQHTLGMPFHVKGHYHTPANPTSYKQIVQLMMATDNQIHVTFEPTEDTPKEIRIRINGRSFQKIGEKQTPELGNFYSNSVRFEHAYPEDFEDMNLEDHSQRREKLNNFLGKFQPPQVYNHQLVLSALTSGGRKQVKAQVKIDGSCDSNLIYCKFGVQMERSPMHPQENDDWTFKSTIQMLTPSQVPSVKQISQIAQKMFICHAEAEWGSDRKQSIKLRVQGENAKKPQWRQIAEEGSSEEEDEKKYQHLSPDQREKLERQRQKERINFQKKTAFLNKYDMVAEYKLQPQLQNFATRCFELLKSKNFWNTEVKSNPGQPGNQPDGQVYASLVIDPITQKRCNISVKTPTQLVRIQSVQLPVQMRPFPLVRKNNRASAHSISQLLERFPLKSAGGRAVCEVDGSRVRTFDGVSYKAPISSKCYSVVAKDCSTESDFVVLMKNMKNGNRQQAEGKQENKIKVITPEMVIECQPKQKKEGKQSAKVQCTLNGQVVEDIDSSEQQQVEYGNDEKSYVTITVSGVQVRFNGNKAYIKISNLYKNGQCGLCGHYNDDAEDEWRMGNNEKAQDLEQFHRSFSIQDGECSADDQADFYQKNSGKFAVESQEFESAWRENDDSYSEEFYYKDSSEERDETWWGPSAGELKKLMKRKFDKRECWPHCPKRHQQDSFGSSSNEDEEEEPVKKTKVIEYNHKICFSQQPVKQCPEGTTPADESLDYQSGEDQQQQKKQYKKMAFVCLNRSDANARQLQRQARRGVIVDMAQHSPSFQETVTIPTRCVRY